MYLPGTQNLTKDARALAGADFSLSHRGDMKPARAPFNVQRILDILISLVALIFFAPLMVAIGFAIKVQDGGPMFFGHKRIGYGGKAFRCWKFRSMVTDAEARLTALLSNDPEARKEWEADHKLKRDPRITLLGDFLRKSSLDELPQLFNILIGEMSVVGPRPIVTAEIAKYGRWFDRYTAVRPGLTGLWQVSGRSDIDYRQRVALDVLYVRRASVSAYLRIVARTIPAVILRSGSY